MKYLSNPTTGEVRYSTPLTAKSLARYGWTYTDRKAWVAYQRAQVQLSMMRNIKAVRPILGRVQ